jgi:hypothetical protein
LLVIGSVDKVIRPILISCSSSLPTLLVLGPALMQHRLTQHHMNTGNTP